MNSSDILLIVFGLIILVFCARLLIKPYIKNNPFKINKPFEIDDLALYNTMHVVLNDMTEFYKSFNFNHDDNWYFSKLEPFSFKNHISKMYFEIDKDKNTISYSDNIYMTSAITFTINSSHIDNLRNKFEHCFDCHNEYYNKKRKHDLSNRLVNFNPSIKQYKKTT
jgi:hypothetical protein